MDKWIVETRHIECDGNPHTTLETDMSSTELCDLYSWVRPLLIVGFVKMKLDTPSGYIHIYRPEEAGEHAYKCLTAGELMPMGRQ